MNQTELKEMDSKVFTFLLFISMIVITAINLPAINNFLAKYNNVLEDHRELIFSTGIILVLITVLATSVIDRRKLKKQQRHGIEKTKI